MDLGEPGDEWQGEMRQATLHCGVASLTATAERAPFTLHAQQVGSAQGRGAVSDLRLPRRGHDQPRRSGGQRTVHHGPARGALARKDAR
ncbi:DUF6380 family protein [Streptomyces sp. NPDC001118]|uniref:DUF6380 family protein n=1 Tax=unclassified Streptomyces TaxID=2593676 RepID=UPI00331BFD6D